MALARDGAEGAQRFSEMSTLWPLSALRVASHFVSGSPPAGGDLIGIGNSEHKTYIKPIIKPIIPIGAYWSLLAEALPLMTMLRCCRPLQICRRRCQGSGCCRGQSTEISNSDAAHHVSTYVHFHEFHESRGHTSRTGFACHSFIFTYFLVRQPGVVALSSRCSEAQWVRLRGYQTPQCSSPEFASTGRKSTGAPWQSLSPICTPFLGSKLSVAKRILQRSLTGITTLDFSGQS